MKIIHWTAALLLAAAALLLVYGFTFYPAEYVARALLWADADVNDYRKFPSRPLEPGATAFHFPTALDEAGVRRAFQQDPQITNLEDFLEKTSTQAFIVIQDGRVRYERYFNGSTRDSVVTSFSVAKSFTSALVGIALEEGAIHSIDDPITDYLPELAERDTNFSRVTIRDLLTMSSGIHYVETSFLNGDGVSPVRLSYRHLRLEELDLKGSIVHDVAGVDLDPQHIRRRYRPAVLVFQYCGAPTGFARWDLTREFIAVADRIESVETMPVGMNLTLRRPTGATEEGDHPFRHVFEAQVDQDPLRFDGQLPDADSESVHLIFAIYHNFGAVGDRLGLQRLIRRTAGGKEQCQRY